MKGILVIGKMPPPLGGVTIHVQRLVRWLERDGREAGFRDVRDGWLGLFRAMLSCRLVHINVSSSYLMLFLVIIGGILRKETVMTYHGNVGRWGGLRNFVDQLSFSLVDLPLVLNQGSLCLVRRFNRNVMNVSAFIPPLDEEPLQSWMVNEIERVTVPGGRRFCTNASRLAYDTNGAEIYGVMDLMKIFSSMPEDTLIVSDPSGDYGALFRSCGTPVPPNVAIISEPHSFVEVVKRCDVMVRATSTDGDSISLREAVHFGVGAIASDCVGRPAGVDLYETGCQNSLERAIREWKSTPSDGVAGRHGFHDVVAAYEALLPGMV